MKGTCKDYGRHQPSIRLSLVRKGNSMEFPLLSEQATICRLKSRLRALSIGIQTVTASHQDFKRLTLPKGCKKEEKGTVLDCLRAPSVSKSAPVTPAAHPKASKPQNPHVWQCQAISGARPTFSASFSSFSSPATTPAPESAPACAAGASFSKHLNSNVRHRNRKT